MTLSHTGRVFDVDLPLVGAPLAGGASTTALVEAVYAAGGLGFFPAGYRTPEDLAAALRDLRGAGVGFGVNLFVPDRDAEPVDRAAYLAYRERLLPEAEALGVELPAEPVADDDHWDAKVDLLATEPAAYVSFTFGLPTAAEAARLKRAGSLLLGTVTTLGEACAAAELGLDALVVQGSDAGGHSGTYDPRREITPSDTAELTRAARAATGLPVVAAGGVDGSIRVTELLHAGASAVAIGTLLLRTDESGLSRTHQDALASPRFTRTAVTRSFTGRPARGLLNGFMTRHEAFAPIGYPAIHHLTRPLRAAAAKAGDPERVHLWAGTGFRSARSGPAADVVRDLAALA